MDSLWGTEEETVGLQSPDALQWPIAASGKVDKHNNTLLHASLKCFVIS